MHNTTSPKRSARKTGRVSPVVSLACVAILSACSAGPPVQEMSDARQAIAAAREAGAAEYASGELRDAEDHLDSALRSLSRKDYQQARVDAVEAKNRALAALATTEGAAPADPPR